MHMSPSCEIRAHVGWERNPLIPTLLLPYHHQILRVDYAPYGCYVIDAK